MNRATAKWESFALNVGADASSSGVGERRPYRPQPYDAAISTDRTSLIFAPFRNRPNTHPSSSLTGEITGPTRTFTMKSLLIIDWTHTDDGVWAKHRFLPIYGYGSDTRQALDAFGAMFEMHWESLIDNDATGGHPRALWLRDSLLRLATVLEQCPHPAIDERDYEEIDLLAAGKWTRFCQGVFEHIAKFSENDLIALIKSECLRPSDVAIAAEVLGEKCDSDKVVPTLLGVLHHPAPLAREGAIHGLAYHMTSVSVAALREVAKLDPNATIRAIALEILDP